jgi:predicted MPP superfamily phosphohydrolase
MTLFAALFLSIVVAAHAYVAWRFVATTHLPRLAQAAIWATFIGLALAAPLSMIYARLLVSADNARNVLWGAYLWLGFFFILFCITVAVDSTALMGSWWARWAPLSGPTDPMRRISAWRLVRTGQLAVAAWGTWHAVRVARRGPEVTRVEVTLKRLPKALDGFTIAQISDLHVASLLRRDYVERVVALTLELKPSLIAVTGDLVDGTVKDLRPHVAPLGGLKAPHGCFFVTGNHEYYSGVEAWLDEVRLLGMQPLRNERVTIGEADASFDLAGVDDWTAEHFGLGHGADLPRALLGRDESRALVLLAHQPRAVHEAAQLGVDLVLSGHTHGGQIFPFGALVRLVQPFVRGLHRLGDTQIYVNRGTGFWGPPMRLGSAPEITLLTLRAP